MNKRERVGVEAVQLAGWAVASILSLVAARESVDQSGLWCAATALGTAALGSVLALTLRMLALRVLVGPAPLRHDSGFTRAFLVGGAVVLVVFLATRCWIALRIHSAETDFRELLSAASLCDLHRGVEDSPPPRIPPSVGSDRNGDTEVRLQRIASAPAGAKGLILRETARCRYEVAPAHAFLPVALRAEGAMELGWVAFLRHQPDGEVYRARPLTPLPTAERRSVSAEQVSLHIVEASTRRALAVATLQARPPRQVDAASSADRRVESARIAVTVEEALTDGPAPATR